MEVKTKRSELLEWLETVENPDTLQQIEAIKNEASSAFDFEKEWERGYTHEEARAESIKRIHHWWGKQ